MRHCRNCLKNKFDCLLDLLYAVYYRHFIFYSFSPGKKQRQYHSSHTWKDLYCLSLSLCCFPCFILDVAQPELHTGFKVGAHTQQWQCQLCHYLWLFLKTSHRFLLLFVIRKGIEDKAESIAVFLYQSCIVSDGADLLPFHKVSQKVWKRYREG